MPEHAKNKQTFSVRTGIGTAHTSMIKVPKPGGVKKGWLKMQMTLSDFRLYLFDLVQEPKSDKPSVSAIVAQVLDMRDAAFQLSCVKQNDVIHANKKDIPLILRITVGSIQQPELRYHQLILCENQTDKQLWETKVERLNKSLRQAGYHSNPEENPLPCYLSEAYDSSLPCLAKINCSFLYFTPKNEFTGYGTSSQSSSNNRYESKVESSKIILGTEDGLFCLDTTKDEVNLVYESKRPTYAIELVKNTGGRDLLAVISGKQRYVRLHCTSTLDGNEHEVIKIDETKNAQFLTAGPQFSEQRRDQMISAAQQAADPSMIQSQLSVARKYALAVVFRRTIYVYEISFASSIRAEKHKVQVKKITNLQLDKTITWARLHDGLILVGHQGSVCTYPIFSGSDPNYLNLVHDDDRTLQFLKYEQALCCVPLVSQLTGSQNQSSKSASERSDHVFAEYLLCFQNTGKIFYIFRLNDRPLLAEFQPGLRFDPKKIKLNWFQIKIIKKSFSHRCLRRCMDWTTFSTARNPIPNTSKACMLE